MKQAFLNYSILVLIIGWVYFFVLDRLNYFDFIKQFENGLLIQVARQGKYNAIGFKLIAVGLGFISFYFAYKSTPSRKRLILILVSLIFIFLSLVFFPNFIFQIEYFDLVKF